VAKLIKEEGVTAKRHGERAEARKGASEELAGEASDN
jgi:hypothetical protein